MISASQFHHEGCCWASNCLNGQVEPLSYRENKVQNVPVTFKSLGELPLAARISAAGQSQLCAHLIQHAPRWLPCHAAYRPVASRCFCNAAALCCSIADHSPAPIIKFNCCLFLSKVKDSSSRQNSDPRGPFNSSSTGLETLLQEVRLMVLVTKAFPG